MAWISDERVRETGVFTSSTVISLIGATANHRRFREAKRKDGSNIDGGDRMRVACIVRGVGDVVCSAQFTSGAQDTLTLDASRVKNSSAGGALPTFATGNSCEVFIVLSADDTPEMDEDGNLTDPTVVRGPAFPEKTVPDLLARVGIEDNEGAFPLGVVARRDGLAGLIAYFLDSTEVVDNEDVFQNENTSTGRHERVDIKAWRTIRNNTVPVGQFLTLLNANAAGRAWLVAAWSTSSAAFAAALVVGHASKPNVFVLAKENLLRFNVVGTNVRVRNDTGGEVTLRYIRPVFG